MFIFLWSNWLIEAFLTTYFLSGHLHFVGWNCDVSGKLQELMHANPVQSSKPNYGLPFLHKWQPANLKRTRTCKMGQNIPIRTYRCNALKYTSNQIPGDPLRWLTTAKQNGYGADIMCFESCRNTPSNLELILCSVFVFQCDISGAVLHFCHSVGTGTVHLVWNPVYSIFYPAQCHSVHLNRLNIFSTFKWGLPLVVAFSDVWRVRLHWKQQNLIFLWSNFTQ